MDTFLTHRRVPLNEPSSDNNMRSYLGEELLSTTFLKAALINELTALKVSIRKLKPWLTHIPTNVSTDAWRGFTESKMECWISPTKPPVIEAGLDGIVDANGYCESRENRNSGYLHAQHLLVVILTMHLNSQSTSKKQIRKCVTTNKWSSLKRAH